MSDSAISQIEQHFLMNSVFKRGRRYFDVPKLNHIEHQQSIERRVPESSKQTIDSQVTDVFINSHDMLNNKVNHDLNYYQSKSFNEDQDEVETTYTSHT